MLDGFEQVQERPGLAAGLEEHVVDLEPAGARFGIGRRFSRHACRRLPDQVQVQLPLANALRQPLGDVAQARLHLFQPTGKIVGAGVELRLLGARARQAGSVAPHARQAGAVFVLGFREDPTGVVVEVVALRGGEVRIFRGLALRTAEIVAQGAA